MQISVLGKTNILLLENINISWKFTRFSTALAPTTCKEQTVKPRDHISALSLSKDRRCAPIAHVLTTMFSKTVQLGARTGTTGLFRLSNLQMKHTICKLWIVCN